MLRQCYRRIHPLSWQLSWHRRGFYLPTITPATRRSFVSAVSAGGRRTQKSFRPHLSTVTSRKTMKFTKEQLLKTKVGQTNRELIEQATAPKRENHLNPLGTVLPAITKHGKIRTLEQKPKMGRPRKRGLAVVVTILRCGPNLLDDADNLPYSYKGLIDAIAAGLGLDDSDPRVRWQFAHCATRGEKGTLVRIETV